MEKIGKCEKLKIVVVGSVNRVPAENHVLDNQEENLSKIVEIVPN